MKIVIGPAYRKSAKVVDVYALHFIPATGQFAMPCMIYDQPTTIRCPLTVTPASLHFQWDKVYVEFSQEADAESFRQWLITSKAKAQEDYRHMPG